MAVRHAACVKPESRPSSRWGFESSSEVRIVIGGFAGTIREVQELVKEARQNSPRGSSQVQEFARSLSEHRRGFIGCSPEARRKKRLTHRNTIYSIDVLIVIVSMQIKLGLGGDPINLIWGQLGPWQTQIGPNGSAHSDPEFLAGGGTAQETWSPRNSGRQYHPSQAVVPPKLGLQALPGGGTAQTERQYSPVSDVKRQYHPIMVVVPPGPRKFIR